MKPMSRSLLYAALGAILIGLAPSGPAAQAETVASSAVAPLERPTAFVPGHPPTRRPVHTAARRSIHRPERPPAHPAALVPAHEIALSPAEAEVSDVARQRGDQKFLMIDKVLGRLIVFLDGAPAYAGAALTGESTADRFTRYLLSLPDSHKWTIPQKITPAGRFTVTRSFDPAYGPIFELNEVHGPDWWIAIHQVWLGNPAEHRMERLLSPTPEDNHITFGCINVSHDTLTFMLRHLPKTGRIPVYILPMNERLTSVFFPLKSTAVTRVRAP
jgi:hypothetical protein